MVLSDKPYRGGAGHDAVLAEAQDGSGVNNVNFLTLADGLPGRMQMFLWSSVPLIDGDFDNGVILHEYGHGISTRLTGGPDATCLGGDEQSGEGWSDYFGAMITMDPNSVPSIFETGRGIGTYVLVEGTGGDGIRPAKYSTNFAINDYTYGDLNNSEISAPHGVGFIWATMLWEMTANLVDAYGYDADVVNGNGGNNLAIQLVMTGLTLQPCSPTFVEQRDAILAADQLLYGGANKCLIWEAFARRGLGFSAQSGTNARGDETQAFDMPNTYCLPTVDMTTNVSSLANNGGTMEVEINIINNAETTVSGIRVQNEKPLGTSEVSASHNFSNAQGLMTFNNISVPANSTRTITIVLSVNTASQAQMLLRDDLEANPFGWTASPGLNQFVWSTDDAFSGDYSFKTTNPNNFSNLTLTWNEPLNVTQGAHLRFAHRFNTEANFDGAITGESSDDVLVLNGSTALQGQPQAPSTEGTDRNTNAEFRMTDDFGLAPNPSSTQVQISRGNWTDTPATISVLDARGQLMHTSQLVNQNEKLDVSNWPAGIYLVQMQGGAKVTSKKLVVN